MDSPKKTYILLLTIFIFISSLLVINSANAQSILKPSVPQFHLKVTEHSETLPPVYEIDQFTGKNVTIFEGAYYEWRTLDFTVENQQPPTPNNLYFNIRYKGEYSSNWTYLYHGDTYARAQTGQTSIISFLISGQAVHGDLYHLPIPAGAKVDFQVEAMIGGIFRKSPEFASGYEFRGETSGWSNTQTITIPAVSVSTSTPSPTSSSNPTIAPTSTPTTTNLTGNSISVPLNTLIVVVATFLAIIVALSLLLFRKHRKPSSQNKPNV